MQRAETNKSPYSHALLHDIGYDQAIAQLPPSIRWVTLLAETEGLTPLEIANLAGVSVDVVVEVLERGQSLARDVHHRMIAEAKEEFTEITEVRVKLYGDERLKAFVNVIFDDAFIVRGVKVIDGPKGLFVSMPSRARADGTYQDICHPLNGSMRECIEKAILRGYEMVAVKAQPSQDEVANFQMGANNDSSREAMSA